MEEKKIVKKYTNGEVTVVWQPDMCIHSAICFKGLPGVFNPSNRPWVNIEGDNTQKIIDQVRNCPSGAISFFMNADDENENTEKATGASEANIIDNGPLILKGEFKITYQGGETTMKNPAICRCGASGNKPYCDGSHRQNSFE